MSAELHAPLAFKFHFLNDKGAQTSVFRKKGSFDGAVLQLDDQAIPVQAILQTVVRENRMVLACLMADGGTSTFAIMPASKKETDALKRRLDIARSAVWAKSHREGLEQQGRGGDYRDARCPQCTATILLSDMPESPQLYCHFCDSLTTIDSAAQPPAGEGALRLCDQCGMYSRPTKFTIFYFYFLLVVYGWWSKQTWRCKGCMRPEAWKMFFGNLLFVLGVPVAIVQLIRCYSGSVVGGAFRGLDAANLKARKGDVGGALGGYKTILERVPHSAGIKYNLGLALLQQGDERRAAETLELALADCVNYVPAYRLLSALYAKLGEQDRLRELQQMWGDVEEAERREDAPLASEEPGRLN